MAGCLDTASDGGGDEAAVLWRHYVSGRDPVVRHRLIEHYLPTAKGIAAALFAKRINDIIDFRDYLQYARIGLIEAIDRFDPDLQVAFPTFATYRIRGAILNGIEMASEQAAQYAQRKRAMRERTKSMRAASDSSDDPFATMVDLAIGLALGYMLEESGIWRPDSEDQAADPYRSLEMKRLQQRMGAIVQALPERERQIVLSHYFEHLEFSEIADKLGVSKGRVSQLHARALKLVRDALRSIESLNLQM
ncbi:MAG: sigma-70 family RNA polymerase sigma factor [Gammaproteobacteria bacterium]|nr:sigma-70 family RNA polymerase sigma factor [Gammaproteobacteria bacterium]